MEIRLRDGQLNESLNQLRNSILVKQRLLRYKKTNARHQGPTTRSRALIARQEKKIAIAASTFRQAWKAKLALLDGDQELLGWNELLDEHIVGMEDLQESERRKIKAAKGKRAAAARRLQNGETPLEGAREKHRKPSWIWHGVSSGELGADKVLYEGGYFSYLKLLQKLTVTFIMYFYKNMCVVATGELSLSYTFVNAHPILMQVSMSNGVNHMQVSSAGERKLCSFKRR